MHDEHNFDDKPLPDDVRRAIEQIQAAPLPEDARVEARKKALALSSEPAPKPTWIGLPQLMAGLAAATLVAIGVASMVGTNASTTFNNVGQSIGATGGGSTGLWGYESRHSYGEPLSDERVAKAKNRPNLSVVAPQPDPRHRNPSLPGRPSTLPPPPGFADPAGGFKGGAGFGGGGFGGNFGGGAGGLPPATDPIRNTEDYSRIVDNAFRAVVKDPLSTFSVDVDTASYSNLRRFLHQGQLPPKDAVRIEEMINYFGYEYPEPEGDQPVSIYTEVSSCPWKPAHQLVRIGLQGKRIDPEQLPARNLVFLIDVSGSMGSSKKLPLVIASLKLLVEQLNKKDRVAIAVYASRTGLVLPSTPGSDKDTILDALNRLRAGGSTNGGAGIQLAYKVAQENFIEGGVNRVLIATDGDFNVGITSQGDLMRLIEEKRKLGIFLTTLGYGMGNLKDATLEKLADHGNGHYAYIDTFAEAKKVFVEEGAALVTIAKDVKIQVEFNPQHVQAYRLIGYENRVLKNQDFNNDKKDAGDIGSGHRVTALFEIVPTGVDFKLPNTDDLKYQKPLEPNKEAAGELMTVKFRYKEPTEETSKLVAHVVKKIEGKPGDGSPDQLWATAVAGFGMILRDSPHKGDCTLALMRELAEGAQGKDPMGRRKEFIGMMDNARKLKFPTTGVR